MDSLLVPSSIQRIRAFLIEMCGMKVKPWASGEEMLAALHATLVARQSCDIFWTSLRVLLETLARDLKARQDAAPGTLIDNEILSAEGYASLLDEIRACLAKQTREQNSSFRRLAQGLTAPALGLLLLLGGVATVGCEHSSLQVPSEKQDAAVADTRPSQPDSAQPDVRPDSVTTQPDVRPDSATTKPDTGPDSAHDDGRINIVPLDVASAKNDVGNAPRTGADGATLTIQEIMDSCNIPSDQQAPVLACLGTLRESWTTGLVDYLAGENCNAVSSALNCHEGWSPCHYNSSSATDFDPSKLPLCEPVLIYLGVRFV